MLFWSFGLIEYWEYIFTRILLHLFLSHLFLGNLSTSTSRVVLFQFPILLSYGRIFFNFSKKTFSEAILTFSLEWWVRMCFFSPLYHAYDSEHLVWGHEKGFSPVWMMLCLRSDSRVKKDRLHLSHYKNGDKNSKLNIRSIKIRRLEFTIPYSIFASHEYSACVWPHCLLYGISLHKFCIRMAGCRNVCVRES